MKKTFDDSEFSFMGNEFWFSKEDKDVIYTGLKRESGLLDVIKVASYTNDTVFIYERLTSNI
jgi:hypothetical protein